MALPGSWQVAGSYFEVCNCDAICPCRDIGTMKGGESTYGICEFLLSWHIQKGNVDDLVLNGLKVALAGMYRDDDPDKLWHVMLYVDDGATSNQMKALESIFLGRLKGTPLHNFASAIEEVYSVKRAGIELSHVKNKEYIKIGTLASAQTREPFPSEVGVACAIPGLDQMGQEIVADHFRVKDSPFDWNFEGRCGFATKFSYKND